MKFKFSSICLLLIGFFLFASCSSKEIKITCGISETSQKGINHLQKLIDAMEKYQKDHGKFPKDVFDLVPQYIDRIPIVNSNPQGFDEAKYDVLQNEKLRGSGPAIAKDGSEFTIELIPTDERICLLGGRNNICEYTSPQNPFWNCHQ